MVERSTQTTPPHFKGKEAIGHVAEAQARGILSSAEMHGTEMSGHLSSGADAARETAVVLLMIWLMFSHVPFFFLSSLNMIVIFAAGWLVWKSGRSAWLAWFRLERMHRIVEQERWEIQHHRQQEREELKELYRTKGFEGQLLEDVVNVLMADEDRLLRVMVEEELFLSLGSHEHPLKQGLGSAIGALSATVVCLLAVFLFPAFGMWIGSVLVLGCAAGVSAYFEGNRPIPAIVWNLGLGALAWGCVYFLFEYVQIL
ncbi:MAG: VIT1/CCC1 transporter family protein [Waddliaceae bacterium]